jgi:NAD(P)-dependent dehydrogenase (short-subunit alcohol dehydrogenase family)
MAVIQENRSSPMPANNVVLITGAGRGIGAATAIAAARAGFDVAVNYVRDADAAKEVVQAVQEAGRKAVALQADIGQPEDIARLFAQAEQALGPLTALVNNTGITGPIGPFSNTTDETIERAALDAFQRADTPGVIVNVSSVAARTGSPGEYVHYAASKAALEAFTIGLGRELASTGVRICALAPGSTLTEIHATAGEPGRPARVAPRIPMQRLAEPEEIANAIVWLLTPAASYMTATVVHCAGGL